MKMIIFLACLLNCLGNLSCSAQVDNINPIKIEISLDSPIYKCKERFLVLPVSIKYTNVSDRSILTYGLSGSAKPVSFDLNELCDLKGVGTSRAFAIYRETGKQIMPTISFDHENQHRRVTRTVLDSAIREANISFLKSAVVLKSSEGRVFNGEIPLADFDLDRGLYYLQIVYYCGDRISDVLDSKELGNYREKLYKGCAISLKVPFIIE